MLNLRLGRRLLAVTCLLSAGACAGKGGDATGTGGSSGGSGGSTTAGNGGSGGGGGGSGGGAAGSGGSSAGGAGGSSGSGGAAGSSPDGSAGGSGPPPGSIIIQDNFDAVAANARPDATKWMGYPAGQESLGPVVDNTRFHSAPNAARVTSISSGLGSFLVPAAGLPVAANAFYVRVYINWEKATTSISGHSGFIVGSVARDESASELRLGISSKGPGGTPRMDLNLQNPSDGGGEVTRYSNGFTDGGDPAQFTGTGFQFAANTWYCLEAFFSGTPSTSEFRVWVDSTEVTAMHVTDFHGSPSSPARTMWGPTYNFIKIGANDYDANLGHIWYDDVVVATSPIGCN